MRGVCFWSGYCSGEFIEVEGGFKSCCICNKYLLELRNNLDRVLLNFKDTGGREAGEGQGHKHCYCGEFVVHLTCLLFSRSPP